MKLRDIVVSLDMNNLDNLIAHEERIDELYSGEFDSQLCTCHKNNPEVPPPITMMEALTGQVEIPDLSDPGSDSEGER